MQINYGDIFTLGNHRLMCGDATNRDDVYKLIDGEHVNLVLTDPPYGIKVINRNNPKLGSRGRVYAEVIGDTNSDMIKEHYKIIRSICNNLIIWGGQNFTDFLLPSCGWIFWDKDKPINNKMGFSDGKLAWSNISKRLKKYTYYWNGNVIEGDKKLNARVHPNQKPVELHIKILEDFSKENDVILDCFGGSGTTLIAAECCNRKCLMMEISPEYCEIIIERYIKLNELINRVEKEG